MKSKILPAFICLLVINVNAQDSIFQLKDYKYRTPGYRSLDLEMNFYGNTMDLETQYNDQSSNSFQLQPSRINYYRIRSTDKRIQTTGFYLNPSLHSNSRKDGTGNIKSRNLSATATVYHNDRFYKNNKWFIEINNSLMAGYSGGTNSNNSTKRRSDETLIHDRLSIGFGKGRIEDVQDAQMAFFIINDLKESGLISGEPQGRIINEFASLITDIKNKRVFDNRKRRIYELTRLETFLREKGIVSQTDIRHFTIINDNWALAMNPIRRSGANWFFRLGGTGSIDRDKANYENGYTQMNKSFQYSFNIGPQLGYEKYVPVNLHWQRSMGIFTYWNFITTDTENSSVYNGNLTETIIATRESEATVYMFYGISYFPNNRTSLGGSLALEGKRNWFDEGSVFENGYALTPELNLFADYFISYRTRLNASLHVHYQQGFSKFKTGGSLNEHYFNGGLSFSLFHSIF